MIKNQSSTILNITAKYKIETQNQAELLFAQDYNERHFGLSKF